MAVPDFVPVLSVGSHGHPRDGGCFMEVASFLAGESWTDHPRCVHPMLGRLARTVNDHISDGGRPSLATLIPSVLDTQAAGEAADGLVVSICCTRALPHADPIRRTRLRRVLRDQRPPTGPDELRRPTGGRLVAALRAGVRASIVYTAVGVIARLPQAEADRELRELLVEAIDAVREAAGLDTVAAPPARRWVRITRLLGPASAGV